jgi:hypothetical protein
VLGIAVALLLPAILFLPKVSSFRGDLHDKWHQRCDLCSAALAERAFKRITILRDEATRIVGHPNASFDPASAVGDPQELVRYVKEFQDAISLRTKLDKWLRWMLKSAGMAPIAAVFYVVGTAIGTAYYAKWWEWHPALIGACVCAGGGLVLGMVITGVHFYCDRRLSSAEIKANEATQP